ncbi:MAG: superoxide dismutase family protein, partial [Vicinamibacteria bacterium]
PPGSHAVHIHEVGDCSAPDAGSAGGHWNPTGAEHGQRGGESYHAGDLGNVDVGSDGTGVITIDAEDISLEPEGEPSAMGKAIVVHSGPDDFATQPDGAAGERIGCGVIESEQTTSNPSRNP